MLFKNTLAAVVAIAALSGDATAATIDAIDASNPSATGPNYWVPDPSQTLSSPYYRDRNEDWGWSHNGIAAGFTSAELNISAYDVDFDFGEIDNIYAYDNGVKTLLGALDGDNNAFSFTSFTLGANFFDDIVAGLVIEMDIDVNNAGWLVSLSKSVITTDGLDPGNPNPGTPNPTVPAVPLPAGGLLLLTGLAGLGFVRRKTS